jgi:hypothetical protein
MNGDDYIEGHESTSILAISDGGGFTSRRFLERM